MAIRDAASAMEVPPPLWNDYFGAALSAEAAGLGALAARLERRGLQLAAAARLGGATNISADSTALRIWAMGGTRVIVENATSG